MSSQPSRRARAASSVREATSKRSKMRRGWVSTVLAPMPSETPSSSLLGPSTTSRTTSRSRAGRGPGGGARRAAVPSRRVGWSSTIATRISGPALPGARARAPNPSTRPPFQGDVGPAAGPAPDVEDRPHAPGPLLHVEEPEAAGLLRPLRGVGLDARAGVVDRQRGAGLGRVVADDDRRLAVLHRVAEGLLGHPEKGQLGGRGGARAGGAP